jgi:alanine dehydrogenase
VIGGGVVGTHAARMAVGLGAEVVILDRSLPRLRQLDDLFAGRVRTRFSTLHAIERRPLPPMSSSAPSWCRAPARPSSCRGSW